MSTYNNFATVDEWKNLRSSLDVGKTNRCNTVDIEECSEVLGRLSDLYPDFSAANLRKRLSDLENQIINTNLEYDSFMSSVDDAIVSVQKMEENGEVLPDNTLSSNRG